MVRITLKLVTSLLILLSSPVLGSIGTITESRGGGQIKRVARSIPAAKGSGVEKNDTVLTNSQGRFKITFIDQTVVNITENSKLVIDDFVYDGGGKSKGRLGLKVALGTVRYASGKLAHGGGAVSIRTPTATIGVRGTDFVMSVDEIGRTMIILLPSCFDEKAPNKDVGQCPTGIIDVSTPSGTVTLDKPFQATVVESAQTPPSTPVTVSLEGKNLGNSLQLSAPKTESGTSLIQVARDDVKQQSAPATMTTSSDAVVDVESSEDVVSSTVQESTEPNSQLVVVDQSSSPISVYVEVPTIPTPPVVDDKERIDEISTKDDSFIKPMYDKTAIVSWQASSVTTYHEVGVTLPKDTTLMLSVTQDNLSVSYNFNGHSWPNSGFGTPTGYISIRQMSGK